MIKRRLGFAGILLAGLILVLYLTGGGKIFGRLGVSRCEKLWKESEEVMVEGEVYQKTRKEEKLILYLKKIQIREMGNGKAVADERLLVYLDEKGNGPEIGQRILVKGNVGFFDPAANPGNFDQKNYYKQQNIQAVLWKGKVLEKQVKKTFFREKLWQFRNRTADEICREMGKHRGGILCAVLLGDSFYTEEKVKELYRVAGIGHLLAISGVKTLKLDIPLVPEIRINWAFVPLHIAIIYILKLCLDEEIIPRCRFPCSRGYHKKYINWQKKQ